MLTFAFELCNLWRVEKVIRMCDLCGIPANHRMQYRLDNRAKRELDLCDNCMENCKEYLAHSRPASAKRRHRAYQTRTYQDKTA